MKNDKKYVVKAVGHPHKQRPGKLFTVDSMFYHPSGWKEKKSEALILDDNEALECVKFLEQKVSGLRGTTFYLVLVSVYGSRSIDD